MYTNNGISQLISDYSLRSSTTCLTTSQIINWSVDSVPKYIFSVFLELLKYLSTIHNFNEVRESGYFR